MERQGIDGGVGVEQSSRNGEIIWSKHLPKTCRLSKSVFIKYDCLSESFFFLAGDRGYVRGWG